MALKFLEKMLRDIKQRDLSYVHAVYKRREVLSIAGVYGLGSVG
jgi:hypothetical protein